MRERLWGWGREGALTAASNDMFLAEVCSWSHERMLQNVSELISKWH